MSATYYVYVLFDWMGIPRYVGKGTRNRWLDHERRTDPFNPAKNEFIERTWLVIGEIPKIKIAEHLSSEAAYAIEAMFVKAVGRAPNGPLVNMTDGGDGFTGEKSTDHKALSGARFAALNIARKGVPLTDEHKAKISSGGSGIPKPAHWKLKMSVIQRGVPETDETKQKMRKPRSAKGRANISAAAKTRKRSKHPNQSQKMRSLWADPIYREKNLSARKANRQQLSLDLH